jgi:uncharacterized coiled-coil protein SlyX
MGASNHTDNIYLPVFSDTDKPSWLGDFNDAMNKIDAAFANRGADVSLIQTKQATDEANIAALQDAKTTDEARIAVLETAKTTDEGRITTLESAKTTDEGRITTLETAKTTDEGRLTSLETSRTTDEGRITTLESAKTVDEGRITSLETSRSTDEDRVTTLETEVNKMNFRTLYAGNISASTNASGDIGVYHTFGENPVAVICTAANHSQVVFFAVDGSTVDSTHFIVRCYDATGAIIVSAGVNFYYEVIGAY